MARGKGRKETQALELVESLKPFLQHGVSLHNACLQTGIDRSAIYNYKNKWESVSTRIDAYKATVKIASEKLIAESIIVKKDVDVAKWYLEHKHRNEYSKKQTNELEGSIGLQGINISINKTYDNGPSD